MARPSTYEHPRLRSAAFGHYLDFSRFLVKPSGRASPPDYPWPIGPGLWRSSRKLRYPLLPFILVSLASRRGFSHPAPLPRRRRVDMEKEAQVRSAEGLTPEELGAHGRAELLPDRIEMHRRRRWRRRRRAGRRRSRR